MVAELEVLAVSHMGNMYRFLALELTTVVAAVEFMGSTDMPVLLAPVCKVSVPSPCMLEVEKQIML